MKLSEIFLLTNKQRIAQLIKKEAIKAGFDKIWDYTDIPSLAQDSSSEEKIEINLGYPRPAYRMLDDEDCCTLAEGYTKEFLEEHYEFEKGQFDYLKVFFFIQHKKDGSLTAICYIDLEEEGAEK